MGSFLEAKTRGGLDGCGCGGAPDHSGRTPIQTPLPSADLGPASTITRGSMGMLLQFGEAASVQ